MLESRKPEFKSQFSHIGRPGQIILNFPAFYPSRLLKEWFPILLTRKLQRVVCYCQLIAGVNFIRLL